MLNIKNLGNAKVAGYTIEKSMDGISYSLIETISDIGELAKPVLTYLDNKADPSITYYRVRARLASGEETALPVAMVKAPDSNQFTFVSE